MNNTETLISVRSTTLSNEPAAQQEDRCVNVK